MKKDKKIKLDIRCYETLIVNEKQKEYIIKEIRKRKNIKITGTGRGWKMDDFFERFGLLGAALMMCILMLLYSILMNFSHQESKRKEKEQQEILNLCKSNKVLKTYTADHETEFYVVLENNKIYKVDKDKFGYYIVGEYCK